MLPALTAMKASRKGAAGGFTLLELMVTVSVAAILATVALPSFSALIRSNRSASEANTVLGVFMLARSEAIKRDRRVVACKTANGRACTTSGGWQQGALIFEDSDGDGALDGGEPIIAAVQPLSTTSQIAGNANVTNKVTFNSLGRATTNGTITIVPGASNEFRRAVVLTNTRNPRICYPDRSPSDCPPS
jgi:type IV fimbrial biogenesis protein FimT